MQINANKNSTVVICLIAILVFSPVASFAQASTPFSGQAVALRASAVGNFQDPTSPLYQNAFGPQFPVDFLADSLSGNLPQVSWVLASIVDSDHPPAPSLFGENTLSTIISALTANSALWAKTVLFATYDENGGFFDHVAPVTASPGTPANM